jgi:hypothetical protein
MMRSMSKWIVGVALVALAGGCEDKQCKADLHASTVKAEQLQKDLEAAKAESANVKAKGAKMDELTAQVAALTAENEKLKAAPPTSGKAAKSGKSKHSKH